VVASVAGCAGLRGGTDAGADRFHNQDSPCVCVFLSRYRVPPLRSCPGCRASLTLYSHTSNRLSHPFIHTLQLEPAVKRPAVEKRPRFCNCVPVGLSTALTDPPPAARCAAFLLSGPSSARCLLFWCVVCVGVLLGWVWIRSIHHRSQGHQVTYEHRVQRLWTPAFGNLSRATSVLVFARTRRRASHRISYRIGSSCVWGGGSVSQPGFPSGRTFPADAGTVSAPPSSSVPLLHVRVWYLGVVPVVIRLAVSRRG
jgi:hypothetical protein